MPSREQSAEAHPTMSRGKRSLQLTPGPLTSTPTGAKANAMTLTTATMPPPRDCLSMFDTALSKRLDGRKLGSS